MKKQLVELIKKPVQIIQQYSVNILLVIWKLKMKLMYVIIKTDNNLIVLEDVLGSVYINFIPHSTNILYDIYIGKVIEH